MDILGLINSKADITAIDLQGVKANVVRNPDGTFNIDYILNAFASNKEEEKKEKGKKFDGRSRPSNEAYKNGWNEIFLNQVMKQEVDINGTGTHKYRIKHGPNKGKVL